jgi:hypothetical protein
MVPAGACTLSNSSAVLLAADRFPTSHRCRPIVDAYGAALYYGKGREGAAAARTRALKSAWRRAIARAQFVVLAPQFRGQTPIAYIERVVRPDFAPVHTRVAGLQIYRRHTPTGRAHRKAATSRK